MEDNNITSHKRVSHHYHDDAGRNSSDEKVVAGSFTEDIHRDNASYREHSDHDERRRHIPEHLRIPVPENVGYSPRLSNMGNKIGSFFAMCISPLIKLIRFLQRRTNLTFWIITSMIIGVLIGQFAPAFGKEIKPLGDAFILMIKIIIVPLVFSVLVIGIAGHGDDVGKVGKLAIKTLIVSVYTIHYATMY
jgi:proton glutamate symport protein